MKQAPKLILIMFILFALFGAYMTGKGNREIQLKEVIKTAKVEQVPKSRVLETILFLQPHLDPFIAKPIADAVERSCSNHMLPTSFILSLIKWESDFDPLATSKAGAKGLMQIIPRYHLEKIEDIGQIYIISNNVEVGCKIIAEYLKANNWDIYKALHSYLGKRATNKDVQSYALKILKTNLQIAFFLQTLPIEYEEKQDGNQH